MSAEQPKGPKYYERVLGYRAAEIRRPLKEMPPFDFDTLGPANFWEALKSRALRAALPLLLALARTFFPVFSLGGYHWITRKSDVLDALEDGATFNVPYGCEMEDLSWSTDHRKADFLLGRDGEVHDRQRRIIERVMDPGDAARIADWTTSFSTSLIEGSKGEVDVIGDLILRVPTEICRRYFGLEFADPGRFAQWAMSISAVLFADPTGMPKTRALARAGALRLNRVIDAAIDAAVRERDNLAHRPQPSLTLVQRLVVLAAVDRGLDLQRPEIRAIVLGLVVGFIPTNGLAAANMIEALLKRPEDFDAACAAAAAGDAGRLRAIVMEAGRRNPALAPGQWRYATREVSVRGHRIPAKSTVMVSTMSALRDGRPDTKRPARPDSKGWELMFGTAAHKCMGEHLALVIIGAMFLQLFRQPGLRRAAPWKGGWMQRTGYFPKRLVLLYDSPGAEQSLIVCNVPLASREIADIVDQRLRDLGNPAPRGLPDDPFCGSLADALHATNIVYFASGAVVAANPERDDYRLVLEFNADGPRDAAIDIIAGHGAQWLTDLLHAARPDDGRDVAQMLKDCALDLHFWPWGVTGLNFQGLPGFTVAEIERQERLRKATDDALRQSLQVRWGQAPSLSHRALQTLREVRARLVACDPEFDSFLVQPDKDDPLTRWRAPSSFWAPLWTKVLPSLFGLKVALVLVATWGLTALVVHAGLESDRAAGVLGRVGAWFSWSHAPLSQLAAWVTAVFVGLLGAVAGWGLLLFGAWQVFLWVEAREATDDRPPDPDALAANIAHENDPDTRQNHIIAVTPLKTGLVRRFSLAFALWGIRQSLNWFRPGFVITMGTIHFAKWFRLPGSDKLIFQANYDGSWESYLEDFITRAHTGQTAAWSNGKGFPRSKGLIGEGAQDGDRFKRWVRRQQIPTAFWYSRFPTLTTEEMRRNKLVHAGLAHANTDTKARAWLDLFGSAPRQSYELETPEIQSLVFRGLKRALFVGTLPFRLPATAHGRADWLAELTPRLSFGQFPEEDDATYLALSARGLQTFVDDAQRDGELLDLLAQFPGAFTRGMANRGRILGDAAPTDPAEPWLWQDAAHEGAGEDRAADGVLMIYAPTPRALDEGVENAIRDLGRVHGKILHGPIRTVTLDQDGKIITDARDARGSYEHFGFRDGVSSPVIRGNEKFTPGANPHDVVEPGEFILGYYNNQGYVAPSVVAPSTSDPFQTLPAATAATTSGFADFQDDPDAPFEARDFSRNGFYVVVRQLRQDVDGFKGFTARCAETLNRDFDARALKQTVGDDVTQDWVAAKLVGRWRDGRPLVGNPTHEPQVHGAKVDNDFLFGRDDPRGQACPLGAHIRRVNPRDSLEPEDPLEQLITRRHALIRRGRSYFYDPGRGEYSTCEPGGDAERGLLFVALCSDLERQFELVQQTWSGSPAFHGLTNEPDPISTHSRREFGAPRQFTIPTAAGPLVLDRMQSFVDVRGGGYFFAPSRAALAYLARLCPTHATVIPPVTDAPPCIPPRARKGRETAPATERHRLPLTRD